LQDVRLVQGEYVEISADNLASNVLSLHGEVLSLDLCLYADRRFRFYDPISQQILLTYAEAEFDRSLEQRARF
jgi:hypothetical protein